MHSKYKLLLVFICTLFGISNVTAQEVMEGSVDKSNEKELNIKELILEHLADTYEWHIATINETSVTLPLPIILRSKADGWTVFLSSKLQNSDSQYKQFYIATEGKYTGKIVEQNVAGEEVRPLDISLTKNAASLLLSSFILIAIIMSISRVYKKDDSMDAEKGFTGAMEFIIVNITDEVIKPSIGRKYKRYAPFVLSLFFFILFNNLLGLVPIFPGGANVTGNISVTLVLAVFTFLIVNFTGSKAYYKDLFWPDVPIWLKMPFPLMQIIELVGTITKPFALMIRLFANITAGHSIVLGLTSVVFVTVSLGTAINTGMTAISVLFNIFIFFLEILVAFIQAYIFTVLTSVFIGMAHDDSAIIQEERKKKREKEIAKLNLNIQSNN